MNDFSILKKNGISFLLLTLSLFTLTSKGVGQNIQFNPLLTHSGPLFPSYVWTNLPQAPGQFPFDNFGLSAVNTTGAAVPLNGQNFLGFCVNPTFTDPSVSSTFTFATDGSLLSYNPGSGDYWAVNRAVKFNALKDIFYTYGTQLTTLNKNSQAYADLSTAIGLAVSEIVCDYNGTPSSLNLSAGNSQVYADNFQTPVSGNPLRIFNNIKNNIAGTGVGADFTLYTANNPSNNPQDLVLLLSADMGDLPDSGLGTSAGNYKTLLKDGGPAHKIVASAPRLGSSLDAEPDAKSSALSDGDDSNGGSDDEDGIIIPALTAGSTASVTVNVTNASGKLDAWIDWNNNGDFELSEKIANNLSVSVGNNALSVPVPPSAVKGVHLGARFRISTAGNLSSIGFALDGEVEDYFVVVQPNCTPLNASLCASDIYQAVLPLGTTGAIQWYKDGVAIPGATNDTLQITQAGVYTATTTNITTGCTTSACCAITITQPSAALSA
ncbi:MAG: hypothetical protein K1X92_07475, partial [Bacteroidia bacterium]|nr:hypothetical protein [Bacteroidia bacterium]